jgi:hypothetical protein
VRRIVLAGLFVLMAAAGCGGGSKETTTQVITAPPQPQPPLLTKADYVERADAICRNHQSRREDLESQAGELGPLGSRAKAHQLAELLRKESSNRRAELGELGDLQPPAADAAEVNEILELVRTEADVIDTWAAAYDDLDEAAIRRQQIHLGVTAGRAAQRGRAYGFEVCGQA